MQLDEQLNAYKDIIHLIKLFLVHIPAWQSKVKELQSIPIGVRHNELDYSDNVLWDPMDEQITPVITVITQFFNLNLNCSCIYDDEFL